jgi:tryptophan-rich sensory protein
VGRLHLSAVKIPAGRDMAGLVAFVVLCFGASVLGGRVASAEFAEWYTELAKPPWTPPGWVFGPVWTVLYTLMATAGWMIWREGRSRIAVLLFLLQLALNAVWPWIFFGLKRLDWAFYATVAMAVAILATMVAFYAVRRRAALLLVPYFAWVLFAASLSLAVWRLNSP